MRRVGRLVAGPIAAAALLAGVVLGLAPSRAVSPPALPTLPPLSPLPTLPPLSPLPTLPPLSPLPSIDLGTPLPTIDLGTPVPTIDLGTPVPTIDPGSPRPTDTTATPSASSTSNADPEPTRDDGNRAGAPGGPGGAPASGDEGPGRPAVVELPPPAPIVPEVGTVLIPALGVAVPVLVAVALLALQALGGAAGVRLAQRTLERAGSFAPRWLRS